MEWLGHGLLAGKSLFVGIWFAALFAGERAPFAAEARASFDAEGVRNSVVAERRLPLGGVSEFKEIWRQHHVALGIRKRHRRFNALGVEHFPLL